MKLPGRGTTHWTFLVNILRHLHRGTFATRPRSAVVLSVVAVIATIVAIVVWSPRTPTSETTVSIWGRSAPSGLVSNSDNAAVELGTRFTAVEDGAVRGVKFWKQPAQSGLHVGTLWTSTGRKLATTTFANETGAGWQVANFSAPVKIVAGESYVVSYFAPKGGYAITYPFAGRSATPFLSVRAGSGVYQYGSTSKFPSRSWHNSQYWVDVVFTPRNGGSKPPATSSALASPSASASPSSSAGPTPTATPTPTDASAPVNSPKAVAPVNSPKPAAPVTSPKPVAPVTTTSAFPSASTTGVPAGTSLSPYTGSCTITMANTVIDAKTVECGPLEIRAKGVVISRSLLNGTVYADPELGLGSFAISDSQVSIGAQAGTGIGDGNFTAIRVHVTGGNRSINCYLNCTVLNSFVHGQFTDKTGMTHESGIRMGSGSAIRGNTIACDAPDVAPDAGCSAALTGYGDFNVVKNNTIDGNLFIAGSGGYCTYGGSSTGKPFSAGVNNIRYTNNVYRRGASGKCGSYGPITSFDPNAPGNVWTNNTWDDGTAVPSAN